MRTIKKKIVLWLFAFIHVVSLAQQAEYNIGSNWIYPKAQKYVGMDFINSATGSLINNGTIMFARNLTNNGLVNFSPNLATNPALSRFVGAAQQRISGAGLTRFYSIQFSNQLVAAAYSLEQDITVAYQADFTKGIVTALQTTPETPMNMVKFEVGATAINTSDNSYVDGFVSKLGNNTFTFPIGNGGFYRPISISAPATVNDCYNARYMYANPDNAGYNRSQKVSTLASVSDKEYWVLNHTAGTSLGQVTLSWDITKTSATIPVGLIGLSVARWDGTKWIDEGNALTSGDEKGGTITTNVTGYGVFTLATVLNHPPVATEDDVTSLEDIPLTANVLTNDKVFNGTTLSVTGFAVLGTDYAAGANATIPNVGTITIAANGAFTFKPALNYNGKVPTITYTIKDEVNMTATGSLIITVLPMPEFLKSSTKPEMNNDGTYSWTYILSVKNDTPYPIESIQIKDNMDDVFKNKNCTYTITSIKATGSLKSNGLYNGSNNVNTLVDGISLPSGSLDSIRIEVKADTRSQSAAIEVLNQAELTGTINSTGLSMLSDDESVDGTQDQTKTVIPKVNLLIPDAFSPNGDGINDQLIIVHDVDTKIDMEVFSRDGSLVYKNTDYQNDWTGKGTNSWMGRDLADGTYFISFKLISKTTGELITKGVRSVTLHR